VDAPSASDVGQDYRDLLRAYTQSYWRVYENEAKYQPKFTQLALENQRATRMANLGDAATMSPEIMRILRGYNPQQTALLDTLSNQALEELKLNGALDPAMQRQLQQRIRESQAARGMGYGVGDAALEAYYQTQTAEDRRRANQALASGVATQTANTYRDPFSIMLGLSQPVDKAPVVTNTGGLFGLLGLPYEGRLRSNLATSANRVGLWQTSDTNSTQMAGNVIGAMI